MSLARDLMNADESSKRPWVNVGKLTMSVEYVVWENGSPTVVTKERWERESRDSRSANAVFKIDQTEFNPKTEYPIIERRVKLGTSDWQDITLASILAKLSEQGVEMEHWAELAESGKVWCAFEDRPSSYRRLKSGKPLGIPFFTEFFYTQEECAEYAKKLFGANGNDGSVPHGILKKGLKLWNESGGKVNLFLKTVALDPELSEYADELLAEFTEPK